MKNSKCLIFGCGYLGKRVAHRWHEAGHKVHVTTRSSDRAREFAERGWNPICLDVTQPVPSLPLADCVLWAIGYDRSAPPSQHEVYVEGLRNALDTLAAPPERIIYVSSTGVYGQDQGEWVDEESPCDPQRTGGRLCLEAEQMLRAHRYAQRSIILRLAGIYGPHRVPYLDRIRNGEPLAVMTSGYLNLIHVDDAASVVDACRKIEPPELFVVSDSQPVVRRQYYDRIGTILGRKLSFVEPDDDDRRRQRAGGNKRVANRKMLERLGVTLQYPTYEQGLRAILNNEAPRDAAQSG